MESALLGAARETPVLGFCAGCGNPNGPTCKDDVRCTTGNHKVVPECSEDLYYDDARPWAQSLGEVAHFAARYHLRPSSYSCRCQRVAAVASEPWRAARCVHRSDIPGAFSLVDKRRRSSTHNGSRPRHGISSWQAVARTMVLGRYRRALLRRDNSCVS
jgi:hypothetical protein